MFLLSLFPPTYEMTVAETSKLRKCEKKIPSPANIPPTDNWFYFQVVF